ncbi:alcohol dehydrogenase catalytic domain-containing protein, partial [Actinophytocola sp.]|uniref:alcohol dehydrogenase catalytic domain-containing protein n=1 Tax=Actinophytocola sp. TaxID=1872138 RepID=UPI0039C88EB6
MNTRIGWYSQGSWSGRALEFPRVQGADVCGRIVDVGGGVSRGRIGERVLVRNMLRSRVPDGPAVERQGLPDVGRRRAHGPGLDDRGDRVRCWHLRLGRDMPG